MARHFYDVHDGTLRLDTEGSACVTLEERRSAISEDVFARTQDDLLDEVDRGIAGAEVYSTALTAAVIGLTGAGCDATEFETALRHHRNALAALRRQRWAIPARATKP